MCRLAGRTAVSGGVDGGRPGSEGVLRGESCSELIVCSVTTNVTHLCLVSSGQNYQSPLQAAVGGSDHGGLSFASLSLLGLCFPSWASFGTGAKRLAETLLRSGWFFDCFARLALGLRRLTLT